MVWKQRCVDLKARLLVSVPTHLFDVSHLILKVIDRPLTRHHLLLSVRARPLHNAVHFGPMLLQRGLWRPIGHVSELLRETRSHRSGFCSHPPLRLTYNRHCVCVFACLIVCTHAHLEVHHMCSGFSVCGCKCLHMYTWSGISSTAAAEHWKQEAGNARLKKKKKVQGVLKVSHFCNPVHEPLLPVLPIVPRADGRPVKRGARQQRGAAL